MIEITRVPLALAYPEQLFRNKQNWGSSCHIVGRWWGGETISGILLDGLYDANKDSRTARQNAEQKRCSTYVYV